MFFADPSDREQRLAAGLLLAGAAVDFCAAQYLLLGAGLYPLGLLALVLAVGNAAWVALRPAGVPAVPGVAAGFVLAQGLFLTGAYLGSFSIRTSLPVVVLLTLSGLCLFFAFQNPWQRSAPERRAPADPADARSGAKLLLMVGVAAGMAGLVWACKVFLGPYDPSIAGTFFILRFQGYGADDIAGVPFTQWGRLWLPLLVLAAVLFMHAVFVSRPAVRDGWRLLGLFLAGNACALALTYLSSAGFGIIPLQVRSVNSHFYNVAHTLPSFAKLWDFVTHFAHTYMGQVLSHPASHPPLVVALHWVLIRLTGDSPALIGLLLGACAFSAVVPVYFLGKELYHRDLGYAAAALYIALPNALIFSHVALDAMIAAGAAWTVYWFVLGLRRGSNAALLLAGLAFAATGAMSYVILTFAIPLFALALVCLRDRVSPVKDPAGWLREAAVRAAWFLVGVAAPYGLIQWATGGQFDYVAMMQYNFFHLLPGAIKAGGRLWAIWFWLSPAQYLIHSGAAVTALLLWRWREILRGDWRHDALPWAGLIAMLIAVGSATTRNEMDRGYMIYNVFLVLTAAVALWAGNARLAYQTPEPVPARKRGAKAPLVLTTGGVHLGLLLAAVAFSYLNALAIEMLVTDFW